MSKFRVCIAIETFLPLVGGSEKQAFLQSKYLRSQGIEASILTMHFQRGSPASEHLEGVPVSRIAGRILAWHDHLPGVLRHLCYLFALLALGRQLWMRRHDYEIVHVFQLTLFTLPALVVCRLAHKPLVIGMRCDSSRMETDQSNQSRPERSSWADLDGLARLGRPALSLIARLLQDPHVKISILSVHMRESLKKYGLDGGSVELIPNGVDTLHFHPSAERGERGATVVCVAKLRYQKGIDVLLHAWRLVVEQLPEARLLIVGDGPLLAALRDLARALEIASRVEFAGLCSDVAMCFQQGCVAVLPSRWEGMPNALLEAMSSGLACVATRVSGSKDLLGQGERGLLVEPGDVEDLAAAILLLLKDSELARRYGQAARQYIERYYAFPHIMYRHLELYDAMIDKARQRRSMVKK